MVIRVVGVAVATLTNIMNSPGAGVSSMMCPLHCFFGTTSSTQHQLKPPKPAPSTSGTEPVCRNCCQGVSKYQILTKAVGSSALFKHEMIPYLNHESHSLATLLPRLV